MEAVFELFVGRVQRQPKLLNGGDNYFVAFALAQHAPYQGFGVGIFLYTSFLKTIKFFAGLPVKIFAIHHKQTFLNFRFVFQQGGCFERCKRFATSEYFCKSK